MIKTRTATRIPARGRLTIRARLTATYAALVTVCGAVLIGVIYVLMRFVPDYEFLSSAPAGTQSPADQAPATTAPTIPESSMTPPPSPAGETATIVTIGSATDLGVTLLQFSGIALVILVLVSAAVGWIIAGRVLAPLKAINTAATVATTGSLDHRIDMQGPQDEIRDLANTFDTMLAALERSFLAHRRFAANASHELQTPLATTQTMIDVTLGDPDADNKTLRALATRIHEVNSSNIQTVDALLQLASIGTRELEREQTDVRALTAAVVRSREDEARQHEVSLHFECNEEEDLPVVDGDAVLLRQAITNLVQNAIRHNIPGGSVAVLVNRRGQSISLRVCNTGRQIPSNVVDALREPFVRGEGRTNGSGHGLGLAIAASIIDAHHGDLRLTPNPEGGLTVDVRLLRTD